MKILLLILIIFNLIYSVLLPQQRIWYPLFRIPNATIMGIDCANPLDCIVKYNELNFIGKIKATNDGGNAWYDIDIDSLMNISEIPFRIWEIHYPDTSLCYLVCHNRYDALILKSTNKGFNWEIYKYTPNHYYSLIIYDKHCGFMTSVPDSSRIGAFYYTTDGGESWQQMDLHPYFQDLLVRIKPCFRGSNNLFHYAESDTGMIFARCNNFGETWEFYPAPKYIRRIKFVNENIGFAVGKVPPLNENETYKTLILKTYDGGRTWLSITDTNERSLGVQDIDFFDENNAIAIGFNYMILRTHDGGYHWIKDSLAFTQRNTYDGLFSIRYTDENHAFLNGHVDKLFKMDVLTNVQNTNPKLKKNVFIYPNPIEKGQSLYLANYQQSKSSNYKIDILDLLGRLVYSAEINDYNSNNDQIKIIDYIDLNTGFYILKFSNNTFINSFKLLVK